MWLIEHFDAADKHRLLTVTKPIIDEIWPNAVLPEGVIGDFTLGLEIPPLNTAPEFGAVIAVFTVAPPVPDTTVEPTYTAQIAFRDDGQIPPVLHVVPTLRSMLRSVDNVAAAFRPFFE